MLGKISQMLDQPSIPVHLPCKISDIICHFWVFSCTNLFMICFHEFLFWRPTYFASLVNVNNAFLSFFLYCLANTSIKMWIAKTKKYIYIYADIFAVVLFCADFAKIITCKCVEIKTFLMYMPTSVKISVCQNIAILIRQIRVREQ